MARVGAGTREADPPFDFAQGRLFEDDRKKSKSNGKNQILW